MTEKACLDYLELIKNKPYKKNPLYKLKKRIGKGFVNKCLLRFLQQTFYKDFHAFIESERQQRCMYRFFYIGNQNIPKLGVFKKAYYYRTTYLKNNLYNFVEYNHNGPTGIEFDMELNDEIFGKLKYTDERIKWAGQEKMRIMTERSYAYQNALWLGYAKS